MPSPALLATPRSRERGDAGDGTGVRSQSAETTSHVRRDTAAIAEAWGPTAAMEGLEVEGESFSDKVHVGHDDELHFHRFW